MSQGLSSAHDSDLVLYEIASDETVGKPADNVEIGKN